MSVPLHWNDAGLPIGIQFVAGLVCHLINSVLSGTLRRAYEGSHYRSPRRALMRRRAVILVIAVGAAVWSGPSVVPAAGPEGTITWGLHVTLAARWLDPLETEALLTPYMVLYAIHDALVKPMPSGILAPSLAESWSISKDGRSWDFALRKGIRFHNGDPVTADDVKFSFERYRGAAATVLKERVREVQVVDPGRVRFVLKEAWPDFMTFYGTTASAAAWVVPKKYVEKVGDDAFKKAPIGAGPYKVVSVQPGVELVLEAYEGYWRTVPHVKRLVMRSISDETTRLAALKKGEVDIAYLFSGPTAEELRRTSGLRLVPVQLDSPFWIDLPEQWDPKSPWHDRRVRLAASLAVDRQALNHAETLGFARLTGSIVPRRFEFALSFEPPPFDAKRARELLADAGYPNGFDAGDFIPYPPYFAMGEAIQGQLQAVGIRSRVRTMERAAFLTAWRQKQLKGILVAISGSAGNAATRIEAFAVKGGLFASGSVLEIDELFQRQARELDRKKRERVLDQIQRIMHDQVLHIPLYEHALLWGVGPRVEESGADLIKGYPYSAPYEDLKLNGK
jgi:peptide/nickel transport system substrate-binding protein